jgi:hypothetical protein
VLGDRIREFEMIESAGDARPVIDGVAVCARFNGLRGGGAMARDLCPGRCRLDIVGLFMSYVSVRWELMVERMALQVLLG